MLGFLGSLFVHADVEVPPAGSAGEKAGTKKKVLVIGGRCGDGGAAVGEVDGVQGRSAVLEAGCGVGEGSRGGGGGDV